MRSNSQPLLAFSLSLFFLAIFVNPLLAQKGFPTSTWEKDGSAPGLFSRIFIDSQSGMMIAYRDCSNGNCSWGSAQLRKKANGYHAVYNKGLATYELFVRLTPEKNLIVTTTTSYTDSKDKNVSQICLTQSNGKSNSGGISDK